MLKKVLCNKPFEIENNLFDTLVFLALPFSALWRNILVPSFLYFRHFRFGARTQILSMFCKLTKGFVIYLKNFRNIYSMFFWSTFSRDSWLWDIEICNFKLFYSLWHLQKFPGIFSKKPSFIPSNFKNHGCFIAFQGSFRPIGPSPRRLFLRTASNDNFNLQSKISLFPSSLQICSYACSSVRFVCHWLPLFCTNKYSGVLYKGQVRYLNDHVMSSGDF